MISPFSPIILATTLLFSAWGHAAPESHCLSHHVREAIKINQARMPVYSKASQGRSESISKSLIQFEKDMALTNRLADFWALRFQRQGIPVICADLKDMNLTPPLPDILPVLPGPALRDFKNLDIQNIQTGLRNSLRDGLIPLAEFAENTMAGLYEPRLNCMTRHFLHSIFVFAENGEKYLQQIKPSQRKNLDLLLRQILKAHINYLKPANALDHQALGLQIQGIPILCQDIP